MPSGPRSSGRPRAFAPAPIPPQLKHTQQTLLPLPLSLIVLLLSTSLQVILLLVLVLLMLSQFVVLQWTCSASNQTYNASTVGKMCLYKTLISAPVVTDILIFVQYFIKTLNRKNTEADLSLHFAFATTATTWETTGSVVRAITVIILLLLLLLSLETIRLRQKSSFELELLVWTACVQMNPADVFWGSRQSEALRMR